MTECAIETDFRRRTSARLGARRLRRPRGARVVVSRGLELEVTIRGSGTLAASALARLCEATRVSLPRGGVSHGNARVVYSNADYSYAPLTLREFGVWRSVSAASDKSEFLYEEEWGQSSRFIPQSTRRTRIENVSVNSAPSAGGRNEVTIYDSIGNRTSSSSTGGGLAPVTHSYTANGLNQYDYVDSTAFIYDADGNLVNDGRYSYAYDCENRLVSVTPVSPSSGDLAIVNEYDHMNRRVRKTVRRYDGMGWSDQERHSFVWDGWNIVLERIDAGGSTAHVIEYYWGEDFSGTEQGAGGVGGLLAVSYDGEFYVPIYGGNGNIMGYVDESGTLVAKFVYDPYGNVVLLEGDLPLPLKDGPPVDISGLHGSDFSFGFSTKYHDREVGLIAYQLRSYSPTLGRWLNRDPIEEEGCVNLFVFCVNNPLFYYDVNGCWALIDNAIAAIGGALVGVSCQAIADIIRGEASGWEHYVGAAVAGAAMGEILLHNPAMAGTTKVLYSGMAAAAGNIVKQVCAVEISKKQEKFNTQELIVDFTAGATLSMLPFAKIEGVNAGQNSFLSIARSMNTKFINGSISRVSTTTTFKSFVGTAMEYGMAYGATQPYVTDKINQGVYWLSDMLIPAYDKQPFSYNEFIVIRVMDKCGNIVELYYKREVSNGR